MSRIRHCFAVGECHGCGKRGKAVLVKAGNRSVRARNRARGGPGGRPPEGIAAHGAGGQRPPSIMSRLVGEEGFEPSRPRGHTDLNRARLPFRHPPGQRVRLARPHVYPHRRYDRMRAGEGGARVGVLQRFERRLEGMVEGAFARAFKSEVEPVEIASAVQREMDDRAAIVAQGRTLVPNDFVVELSHADHERLEVYADNLGIELATLAREHAKEQGYSFVGPVRMRFEGVPDLTTGTFRIRSGVIRGTTVEGGEIRRPASDLPRPPGAFSGRPRLLVSGPEPGADGSMQRTYELTAPVTMLGRGTDCDLRLVDPGVSRHHAELRVEDDEVVLVDLGSTNGTFVNGEPVRRVALTDGTRVTLGRTTLVFRRDAVY